MRPDLAELVNKCESAKNHLVANRDMTSKTGTVGKDNLVTKAAIMGYVNIGHEEIIISDAGYSSTFDSPGVQGT
jgi:hypothetical protein